MFKKLYYFHRVPFGLDGLNGEAVVPEVRMVGHDSSVKPEARELYGKSLFIETIPVSYLRKWKKSGQLGSFLDAIVKHEWDKYNIEQWSIDATKLDMSRALILDTYPYSPEMIGKCDDVKAFRKAYAEALNTVMPLSGYRKAGFKNPQILLPFEVRAEYMALEKRL